MRDDAAVAHDSRAEVVDRGNHLDRAIGLDPNDAPVGLDVALMLARPLEDVLNYQVGLGEDPLDVRLALGGEGVGLEVGAGATFPFTHTLVRVGVRVQDGGICCQRRLAVETAGKGSYSASISATAASAASRVSAATAATRSLMYRTRS